MSVCVFSTLPDARSPWDIRGLMFGDGLFETMLVWDGAIPFANGHRQRLARGCAWLGLNPDLQEVWSRLESTPLPERAILKLLVGRGGEGRGFLPDPEGTRCDWSAALLNEWHPSSPQPAVIGPSVYPALPPGHPLAGIKSLSAAHWVQVRREAEQKGWLDAVVLSLEGFLAEGTGHNIFWLQEGGRVVTPALNQGILPGIGRRRLIERLHSRGVAVEERPIHPRELVSGSQMLLSNAVVPPRSAFWIAPPSESAPVFPAWLDEEVQAWPAP